MADRPILFQGAMVRAILDGSKTQTRRLVKPQPPQHTVGVGRWQDPPGYDSAWWAFVREGAIEKGHPFGGAEIHSDPWRCPYGRPGDRLWVRERWNTSANVLPSISEPYIYGADLGPTGVTRWAARWKPSIHMPRAASRITLEVTDVRVERLQDISEADARAEGVQPNDGYAGPELDRRKGWRDAYRQLWERINGTDSWGSNPWVWAVEFKRPSPLA